MERGGVHIMVSFLAGTLISALLQSFTGIHISQPFLLSVIFLLITGFITLFIPDKLKSAAANSHIILFLSTAVFFLCGVSNMQRNLPSENYAKQYNYQYQIRTSLHDTGTNFFTKFPQTIKNKFSKVVEEYIPNTPDRAVVLALTIGDKSNIPPSLKEAYRKSGATHLLALSGMHAAIIYGIISFFLFFLNLNYVTRRYKFFISATAILLFTYITGFSASVQRAAIMIIVWKGITIYNRKAHRWSAWLISACIILIINPAELYNVGFQLSFASVAGIIALYPVIKSSLYIWEKHRYYKYIKPLWEMAGISVACQIATAPLAWYYFNSAPTYFLITNLAAMPLSTLIIYALAAALVTSPLPVIGNLSALLLQKSIWLLNYIIEHIGMLS